MAGPQRLFSGDDYGEGRQRYLHEQFHPLIAGGKQGNVPDWSQYTVLGDIEKDKSRGYNLTANAQDELMREILLQLMKGDPTAKTRFEDYKEPTRQRAPGDPLLVEAQGLVGRY